MLKIKDGEVHDFSNFSLAGLHPVTPSESEILDEMGAVSSVEIAALKEAAKRQQPRKSFMEEVNDQN